MTMADRVRGRWAGTASALTAIVLDGLRLEVLTGWSTPTALWGVPAAMLAAWVGATILWPRLQTWTAVGGALVLASALPLSLFLDLMGLTPWVLVASTRHPHLMGHTRTRWALGLFCLHIPFMWLALPFVPGITTLGIALTILVSLATTALPMLLVLGHRPRVYKATSVS